MNLERTKPETLAAAALNLTPSQSLAAHEYAERLNAALARLGLTDRLTLPPAPATAIDELPAVVDVPLRKTLSVLMGKAQQGDASALATLEWTAQVAESIFAGLHARDFAGDRPLALPSHESLATLSQGVDALLPRKISNGAWSLLADGTPSDGIQDGMSLVRLFCTDAFNSVTELKDDNEGWDYADGKAIPFTNLRKIQMNCKRLGGYNYSYQEWFPSTVEDIQMDSLERFEGQAYIGFPSVNPNYKVWYFPKLKYSRMSFSHSYNSLDDYVNDWTEEIIMPEMIEFGGYASNICLCNFTALRKLVLGLPYTYSSLWLKGDINLIHLEFTKAVNINTNLSNWNPTSVLSDSERLPIFLSNFKTYIAERLSERGSGLTLTLSQAVRDAIEGDPTIAQIITSKGWTISPAPTA